jgi:crotonobetainyl-CoA:carnitine CoA-transferase CaiB-like acyl-CoA transferase
MVREVGEAISLPQLAERGMVLPLKVPGLPDKENVHIVNAGFRMTQDGPGVSEPPPVLGEHGAEILRRVGYDQQAIDSMFS